MIERNLFTTLSLFAFLALICGCNLQSRHSDVVCCGLIFQSGATTYVKLQGDDNSIELNEITEVHLSECEVDDELLRCIIKLENLRELNLNYTTVDNDDLELLSALPNLESLRLRGTQVSKGAIAILEKYESLLTVDLAETSVAKEEIDRYIDSGGLLDFF